MSSTTTTLLLSLLTLAPQEPTAPSTTTLAGRVVDLRGEGVPVARVWVTSGTNADEPLARSVTDAEGYFRIGRVPQREGWYAWATADGRSTARSHVRSGTSITTLELHDATTVRGVLKNDANEPVAGVFVCASPAGRALDRRQLAAVTDEQGRFAIDGVPLGLSQFTAWVPGAGLAELRHRVRGDDEVALQATKDATTSFQITVDGLPKEGRPDVTLSWLPYRNGSLTWLPEPYYRPRIEGDAWRAEGLPDWRYLVRLSAAGYAFEPDEIECEPGKGPHQIGFVATRRESGTLACPAVVRGPDGEPVAGVSFEFRRSNGGVRATATSDAEGALVFQSPLAAGTPIVVFSTHDDWVVDQLKGDGMYGTWDRRFLEDHECKVDPGSTLQLRVIPACSVSGTLLRPDGKPAPFVRVELQEANSSRWPHWMAFAWATTDREGRYRFRRLHHSPGDVRVLVEGAQGTAASDPHSIAAPGSKVDVATLTLAPPSAIEGVVRDANGRPAPGVAVWLRDWEMERGAQRSGSVTEVITDREGRFRFLGVPVGGAWLQLVMDDSGRDDVKVVEPFEVEPGKTYSFDVVEPAR